MGQLSAGVVQGMAERAAAVRVELKEAERRTDPAGQLMANNLRNELVTLESRHADAQSALQAPRVDGHHVPETPMWLRLANAEGLLRETLSDLNAANKRVARLEATMHAVELALQALPVDQYPPTVRDLAGILADARRSR